MHFYIYGSEPTRKCRLLTNKIMLIIYNRNSPGLVFN